MACALRSLSSVCASSRCAAVGSRHRTQDKKKSPNAPESVRGFFVSRRNFAHNLLSRTRLHVSEESEFGLFGVVLGLFDFGIGDARVVDDLQAVDEGLFRL